MITLTVQMFLFWCHQLFGGGFANGFAELRAGKWVFSGDQSVSDGLPSSCEGHRLMESLLERLHGGRSGGQKTLQFHTLNSIDIYYYFEDLTRILIEKQVKHK